jgi:glutamyl-tRNA synthetase
MSAIRTRIAPSPTGFLHLGTARTALFCWAFARHFGGRFVLRIEDTDVERSTQEAVEQIIAALQWLGLDYDEGPYYQMQRLARYRQVIGELLAAGHAYWCYATPEELEAMRERQRAAGQHIRYDGSWRPEPGKTLPAPPDGVRPVVRFRNPSGGLVGWHDLVKGPIVFDNAELDDLVIARASDDPAEPIGVPTYNFCVVVDDWDMRISHVIRGDDHVNNTPRQINILKALGAPLPQYGHCPMILGPDGEKLSKRHGAVSVLDYRDAGYLPEALLNYLARLGWSHGDDELFDAAQLVQWFDGEHLSKSAAQWDPKKLDWVNAHHLKRCAPDRLGALLTEQLRGRGVAAEDGPPPQAVALLLRERVATVAELAEAARMFYEPPPASAAAQLAEQLTDANRPALAAFAERIAAVDDWKAESIAALLKALLTEHRLKMPQLAIPLRLAVFGRRETPSVDAVLALMDRERVRARIVAALEAAR